MAVGDWHKFSDGYRFRETLLGPLVRRECSDCGTGCAATPEASEPLCGDCGRARTGAPLPQRATYPTVKIAPRAVGKRFGSVAVVWARTWCESCGFGGWFQVRYELGTDVLSQYQRKHARQHGGRDEEESLK